MRKLFALILALCLVCAAAAAMASAEVLVSDGSPVAFEGFTLNMDAGVFYMKDERQPNALYVQVFPFYAATGDDTTNLNAVWIGTTGVLTVSDVGAMIPSFRTSFTSTYAASGYTLESIDFDDPYAAVLGGEDCVILQSTQRVLDAGKQGFDVYQRQYYIGSTGYIFTATGRTPELLNNVCAFLESVLSW